MSVPWARFGCNWWRGEYMNFEFEEIKIAIGEENVFFPSKSFYRTRARSLTGLVTHSLSNSCSVDLIDATLACEGANFKLVDGVTVADIDAEKSVDDNMVQIWKLKLS